MTYEGIFHPSSDEVFNDLLAYQHWYFSVNQSKPIAWIGLLTHQHSFVTQNLEVEHLLITTLEAMNFGIIPVFSTACSDTNMEIGSLNGLVERYWQLEGNLVIDGLINFQMIAGLGSQGTGDLFKQATETFANMGIPVFRPLVSFFSNEEAWRANPLGLNNEIAHAFTGNEMAGMIEPMLIGCREEGLHAKPILERTEKFCRRVANWVTLRQTSNSDKKIALMLHCAPCSGVEATIGAGAGLNVFDSCVEILRRLSEEGYTVKGIPKNGNALKTQMMEKKAIQDFRWTSVEQIVEAGGALHLMPVETAYQQFYGSLPTPVRDEIEAHWGLPPGEGMVWQDNLVITGLDFGHVTVLLQPKRGCYGAKCTGEVCKMLHDPNCPPPHHYLATYRYIERTWGAHAVVHIGTSGSLEYLPGKSNALSDLCWPDIVLGDLINAYIYNAGVGTEGLLAKRRTQAIIVDHLPAAIGLPSSLREDDRLNPIQSELKWGRGKNAHIFGHVPNEASKLMYLRESAEGSALIQNDCSHDMLENLLNEANWQEERQLLTETAEEMASLIRLLNAGFVAPGPAGYPADGLKTILPTGRNFHTMLVEKVPSELAYESGCEMAIQLLNTYEEANGQLPEKIAMNMISTDITATQGEQLSMALNLMGIIPIWAPNGKVMGLEPIALTVLRRPRIDVTTRISGVLRDAYPEAVSLLDQAGMMAAGLDESPEDNFVKKHTDELQQLLQEKALLENEALAKENPEAYGQLMQQLERRATVRVFGDKPGAYGAGVDLALKASAWESKQDMAAIFTEFSAYAYGKDLQGETEKTAFVQNFKGAEATFEATVSSRYDLLSSGFSASVHGGIKSLKSHLGQERLMQLHCNTGGKQSRKVKPLAQEAELVLKETLKDEQWLKDQMTLGSDGAAECMRRIQSLFNWQCLSATFSDQSIDETVQTLLLNSEVRSWLKQENPYALEEISRRLMEMVQRQVWQPSNSILAQLRSTYLEIEGDMETLTESEHGELGDRQGGTVEIVSFRQVPEWQTKLKNSLKDIEV